MSKEEAEEYVVMLEKYHSAGWDIIYKEGKETDELVAYTYHNNGEELD